MKKTALALMLIFALLFSGAELVKMAKANATPIWWGLFYSRYDEVEPVPSTIPPSISIYSPQNNTVYSSRNITVSLYVRNAELAGWESSVTNVYYYLDGEGAMLYFHPINERLPAFNTTLNLSLVSLGKHQLTVEAIVDVLRSNPSEVFPLDCNSTIYFTVDLSGESPTPTPTLAPTSKPAATPEPTFISDPNFLIYIGFALLIIAVVVFAVFLLYFKKRKH